MQTLHTREHQEETLGTSMGKKKEAATGKLAQEKGVSDKYKLLKCPWLEGRDVGDERKTTFKMFNPSPVNGSRRGST